MALLTEEQVMLKDMASNWVRDRMPVSAARGLYGHGGGASDAAENPHASPFAEMAEMGWTGIVVPEAYGGLDFGFRSMGLVLEEMGRTLAAAPLHSSALVAASALTLGGSEVQKQLYLPQIAGGSLVGALAADEGARHAPYDISLAARRTGDGWQLDGVKRPVMDGMIADLFVVSARTSCQPGDAEGITLFLVPGDTAGLTRTALDQVDARWPAMLEFGGAVLGEDSVLGEVGKGAGLLDAVLDRARAGMGAELLGLAKQAFETTVEYMKTRIQFGQPIGSFQALQHRAADLFAEIQLARAAVQDALSAIDAGSDDVPRLVSLAKALAGDTAVLIAKQMIQLHGGIGMTHEHDAGLYLKRAMVAAQAFGSAAYHRDRWGRLSGY